MQSERSYPNNYQRNTNYSQMNSEDNQLHVPYNGRHAQLIETDILASRIASALKEALRY